MDEALVIVDKAPRVYQWPCNCRAMMKGCQKPKYVCLRFENSRDLGWEISKERAKGILLEADKAGLMHSAELALLPDGTLEGAICNCCSDCCYPQQLALRLDAKPIWPINRHIASFTEDLCSSCGRCTKRCPYKAFTLNKRPLDRDHLPAKSIHYNPILCRGCGLCSSTCPEEAIRMQPLEPSSLSIMPEILKSI